MRFLVAGRWSPGYVAPGARKGFKQRWRLPSDWSTLEVCSSRGTPKPAPSEFGEFREDEGCQFRSVARGDRPTEEYALLEGTEIELLLAARKVYRIPYGV